VQLNDLYGGLGPWITSTMHVGIRAIHVRIMDLYSGSYGLVKHLRLSSSSLSSHSMQCSQYLARLVRSRSRWLLFVVL
jgi:hypothetical protein